jgi:hypothetical protein
MPRLLLLLTVLVVPGCSDRRDRLEPMPPEHSGANLPRQPVRPGDDRTDGRGHPDRLRAGFGRAARGDAEVRLEQTITTGGRISVNVEVRTRGKGPLVLGNWTESGRATLRDETGRVYPMVPPWPERLRADREWEAKEPNPRWRFGTGPVTADCYRITFLEFEGVPPAHHLDLDLDGGPVGWTDPILFRIPADMPTELFPGTP